MTQANSIFDLALRPAQLLLDRGTQRSTTAAALCARLEGKTLQISPGNVAPAVHFAVTEGHLQLKHGAAEKPDAELTATPVNLLRLAGDDPEGAIRAGYVKVSGDTEVADDFRTLLNIVRPDWEEELSRVTGDVIAHEAARAVRGVAGWARRARITLGRSLAEYLTEESRDLVAHTEVQEFCAGVDEVSAGVERFEARLQLLREQRTQTKADE